MKSWTRAGAGPAWLRWLDDVPEWMLLLASVLLVAGLGYVDWLTGREASFAVFYLLPVSLAAWYLGRTPAVIVSGFSAVSWLLAEVTERPEPYSSAIVPVWNAGTRLVVFLVVGLLLAALRRALEQEHRLARTDELTGAANSRRFLEVAELELIRARRYGRPFSVAYVDVDDFKEVNDRFGHAVGDQVLSSAAAAMMAGLRATDLVARMGGDEFVILMPETDRDSAEKVADRLRDELDQSVRAVDRPVTFSLGVLTCERPPESVDRLVELADSLMYRVKRTGKNRVEHLTVEAERP